MDDLRLGCQDKEGGFCRRVGGFWGRGRTGDESEGSGKPWRHGAGACGGGVLFKPKAWMR